jgi:hypothetical protein
MKKINYLDFYSIKIYFFLIIIFLSSRLFIFQLIGYNNTIDFFHYSNIELLKSDLLKTIYYNHSQPLLLNFFLGVLLKIFDGNLERISLVFYFLNIFLTIGIIIFSYKIMKLFLINKKIIYFILFVLSINPNFIYYENYSNPIYSHINCYLYFQLVYLILRYSLKKSFNTEFFIYLTLLVQSQIWSAWQPYLILIIFIFLKIFISKFNIKSFLIFLIIFLTALAPSIKNSLLFGSFANSSWTGIYLSTVFVPEPDCAKHNYISNDDIKNAENNFDKKYLKEPSLWGPKSGENNLAIIYMSKRCLEYAVNRIVNDPFNYLKNRTVQFFISHSKLSFENVRGAPDTGKPKWIIKYLDVLDKHFKTSKQLIIFGYMLMVYGGYLYIVIKRINTKDKFKYANILILFLYAYYILVTHLLNGGYETTRMVYGGFVIQLLFFINLLNFVKNKKKTICT